MHQALPPSVPPPPPAPPNPAPVPAAWIHTIATPTSGHFITGKYTQLVVTEFQGDILWQHDWGPLQMHIPLPPILMTPSIGVLPLASQAKYFLPAFAIKEPQEGAVPGGATPIAVSTPAFCINVETCQDSAGWGFVLPAGLCFQNVSTRWVGMTWGDLFAGLIGMAGDALQGLALSGFGNLIGLPNTMMGGVAGAGINAAATGLGLWTGTLSTGAQAGVNVGVAATIPVFGAGVLVSWGAGQLANAVGDAGQPPASAGSGSGGAPGGAPGGGSGP
jgi:hypothetical protein